jgi:hypothetical protein
VALTQSGARGVAIAASERRGMARAREPGPALLAGPVGWRRPASEQPSFPFLILFSQLFSNHILTHLKAFSDFVRKTKVVQNKFLYNFALKCNPKFQIEFEVQFKTGSSFK